MIHSKSLLKYNKKTKMGLKAKHVIICIQFLFSQNTPTLKNNIYFNRLFIYLIKEQQLLYFRVAAALFFLL